MAENVSYMPDRRDRLAAGIKADLTNASESNTAWIDYMVAAAIKTAEARRDMSNDAEFGKWWNAHGLGLNDHARAALVVMGQEPELMRTIFNETDSRSIRLVYDQHKKRFGNAAKPPKPRGRSAGGGGNDGGSRKQHFMPKTDKVREAVRSAVEADKPIERERLAKELKVSPRTVENAALMERGRLEGLYESQEDAVVDRIALSMSVKQKIDVTLKRERGKLAAEHTARKAAFDEEVRQQVLKENAAYLADLEQMRNKAHETEQWYRELINNHQPPLTTEEFMLLHLCVRGDASAEKRHAAGVLLNTKRPILTGKKE
jgi:hypothetical protein